jgi:hypothetical protein
VSYNNLGHRNIGTISTTILPKKKKRERERRDMQKDMKDISNCSLQI